ncbi:MAG: rhodanese-like domain-containing protein [Verrucomicrobia bacterium]|nr:rhodanese-like domain-containing protein [Verrucomicrobiota bacterium]
MFSVRTNPSILRVALQMVALLGASAIAGAVAFHIHPRPPELYLLQEAPDAGEVTMAQVLALEKTTGVLWIDARVRQQYDLEHIPGALLLNPQEFDAMAFDYMDTFQTNAKPIVIYCDAQKCAASKTIMERMEQTGLAMDNEIHVLRGGWNAWKSSQSNQP